MTRDNTDGARPQLDTLQLPQWVRVVGAIRGSVALSDNIRKFSPQGAFVSKNPCRGFFWEYSMAVSIP
jgi:hypothetical protein